MEACPDGQDVGRLEMFVTYRGHRIERFGSNRVDVREKKTNALLKMVRTWDEAIEWIDQQRGPVRADRQETAAVHN
jgi:hypothetical protein